MLAYAVEAKISLHLFIFFKYKRMIEDRWWALK